MITYPKDWILAVTAIKYSKYQLKGEDGLRDVSVIFQKADWSDKWHVIIEDMEEDTPDYYFMSPDDIRKHFGELNFLKS